MLKQSVRAMLALTIAGAGLTACASAAGSANGTTAQPSSRYLLTAADLGNAKADNLYDAIVKMRPEFLRGHGENTSFVQQNINGGSKDPGSAGMGSSSSAGAAVINSAVPVIAYRDNSRLASVDDLKQILLSQVAEVRYMPGPEASVRFGTNHSSGAIIVTSK
jgi:hypothetical protein